MSLLTVLFTGLFSPTYYTNYAQIQACTLHFIYGPLKTPTLFKAKNAFAIVLSTIRPLFKFILINFTQLFGESITCICVLTTFLLHQCVDLFFFLYISKVPPAQGRRDVHIPSFRFASWNESFSLMFTSTRRKGCSSPEC